MDKMLQCNIRPITPEVNFTLTEPIIEDEIRKAIFQVKPHKAPGVNRKGLEFYRSEWNTIRTESTQIMNCMFTDDPLMAQQVKGLVVCIPKNRHPECIGDFRPLTLLNADYKILARIIANRLKPILQDLVHPQQHRGSMGTSVFEAVATIRDASAHSETTHKPLCVIAIDFQSAFERVSHRYLERVLHARGFDDPFLRRIMGLYRNASSEVQVNGFSSNCLPINCAIRQGCPLNTLLYALCINPLLHKLKAALSGVQIRRRSPGTAIIAYADDVTILFTDPDEVQTLQ